MANLAKLGFRNGQLQVEAAGGWGNPLAALGLGPHGPYDLNHLFDEEVGLTPLTRRATVIFGDNQSGPPWIGEVGGWIDPKGFKSPAFGCMLSGGLEFRGAPRSGSNLARTYMERGKRGFGSVAADDKIRSTATLKSYAPWANLEPGMATVGMWVAAEVAVLPAFVFATEGGVLNALPLSDVFADGLLFPTGDEKDVVKNPWSRLEDESQRKTMEAAAAGVEVRRSTEINDDVELTRIDVLIPQGVNVLSSLPREGGKRVEALRVRQFTVWCIEVDGNPICFDLLWSKRADQPPTRDVKTVTAAKTAWAQVAEPEEPDTDDEAESSDAPQSELSVSDLPQQDAAHSEATATEAASSAPVESESAETQSAELTLGGQPVAVTVPAETGDTDQPTA